MTTTVLEAAIQAAIRALADGAEDEANGIALYWTDRSSEVLSIEGTTALIARTAVTAAYEVFADFHAGALVDAYLKDRVEDIDNARQQGREIAALAVEESMSHPALNGGQHWDSDIDAVPDWIRSTAVNAARGTENRDA